MMGKLTFMVNDKMCIGIMGDEMMCRIDPALQEIALNKTGGRIMDFIGRPMKGYAMVDDSGMDLQANFDHWIKICLDFNGRAKPNNKE